MKIVRLTLRGELRWLIEMMWKCGVIYDVGKTFSLFSKTKPTELFQLGNRNSASNVLFGPELWY